MKYETPEMTVLTPAIKAIQSLTTKVYEENHFDGNLNNNEDIGVYLDWE
jgi:hypothetical protein